MASELRYRMKLEALTTHLERLRDNRGHLELHIGFGELITAIGAMQLALRHPRYQEQLPEAWGIVRRLVDMLIDRLDADSPGIGALLREADDPSKDV